MELIKLDQYQELRLITWHITGVNEIPADQAFALYEANWPFIRVEHLELKEIELIKQLAITYGGGVFAPHGGQPIEIKGVQCV